MLQFDHVQGILPVLNTLQITHNRLATVEDVAQLADCDALKVLDLSHNLLEDPRTVEVGRNSADALVWEHRFFFFLL